jgi:hypothetical protein
MARAILHIGTPKTGTTFLQGTFASDRKILQSAGITYPDFDKYDSHTQLALAFNPSDGIRHQQWGVTDRAETLATIAKNLTASIEPESRFVFSTESAARLTDDQVRELYIFLQQFFDEITILVYLRRRDFMLASFFSQKLKAGSRNTSWKTAIRKLQTHEPNALLDRWSRVAGATNVIARPFLERYKQTPDALLVDFCTHVETDSGALISPVANDATATNTSLNAEGAQLLQALNPLIPGHTTNGDHNHQLRAQLVARVLRITQGPPLRVPAGMLERANQRFLLSNTELSRRMGADPLWQEWLDQPSPRTREDSAEKLTAARTAELMAALSVPAGPVDFSQPDWRPRDWRRDVRKRIAKTIR